MKHIIEQLGSDAFDMWKFRYGLEFEDLDVGGCPA